MLALKCSKHFLTSSLFFSDVAVCGLPEPRRDHSVVMARFARDILSSINVLTNELVVMLGPDTGDLMVGCWLLFSYLLL